LQGAKPRHVPATRAGAPKTLSPADPCNEVAALSKKGRAAIELSVPSTEKRALWRRGPSSPPPCWCLSRNRQKSGTRDRCYWSRAATPSAERPV